MTYIVITKHLESNDQYSSVQFDKEGFEKKQNIKLQEKPVSVMIQGDNLILIFEEKPERKPMKSYSVSG